MTDATIHPQSRATKQAHRPAPIPKSKRISPAKQRKLVETAIDRLVDLLDTLDTDADEEPSLGWPTNHPDFPQVPTAGYDVGDDREGYGARGEYSRLHSGEDEPDYDGEHSMGWSNPALNVRGGLDQRKLQTSDFEGEPEPSLGWTEMEAKYGRYTKTGYGSTDLEEEHDGREPDEDAEPGLGWGSGTQGHLHTALQDGENEPSLGWLEGVNQDGAKRLGDCSDREWECEDEGAEHDGSEPEGLPVPGGAGL